jgi:tRNA uridine 5-carboxymethylaminomethyl modification enzyme
VLIDDLVTRGTAEPYRMFTSRAEYRLLLREDNADLRLTPTGRALGLVDEARWRFFERKRTGTARETERLASIRVRPQEVERSTAERVLGGALSREQSALELLRRPEVAYAELTALPEVGPMPGDGDADERLMEQVRLQVDVQAKYAGYIERQEEEIERQRRNEETALPGNLDYAEVRGLSTEARQRLSEVRPATLGQAARVPGITPAAVSLLLIHLKKRSRAA